jgi:hypothetical protein
MYSISLEITNNILIHLGNNESAILYKRQVFISWLLISYLHHEQQHCPLPITGTFRTCLFLYLHIPYFCIMFMVYDDLNCEQLRTGKDQETLKCYSFRIKSSKCKG